MKLVVTESSAMEESDTVIPIKATQVEIVEELTYDEERDRSQLELRVGQAFYQAGKALAELRQRRLYRSTHKTFEAYCQDMFEFTHRHSDYLIAGTVVVENLQQLKTIHSQTESNETLRPIQAQILPTKLEQVKPLAGLKPEEQRQVWNRAVETANGKVPSGRVVKEIVAQLTEKPLVLAKDECRAGDVCTLFRMASKDKKYRGCWAIVVEPRNSTVLVAVHDRTLNVKPEDLVKIDSLDVKQQLPQTLQRIRQLRQVGVLDRGAYTILEALGKQTDLTSVEEGLLSWLEQYYRVNQPQSQL